MRIVQCWWRAPGNCQAREVFGSDCSARRRDQIVVAASLRGARSKTRDFGALRAQNFIEAMHAFEKRLQKSACYNMRFSMMRRFHRAEPRTLGQHSKGKSQVAQHIILHRQLFRAERLDGIDHCSSTCGKHACEQRSKPEDRHRRCQQNRIVSGRLIKLRCDQTAERQGRGQSHH